MADQLHVQGRVPKGVFFGNVPRFCPACGSKTLGDLRWYSKDGSFIHADCDECGCSFGISGVWADPGDYDCTHIFAASDETENGPDRCIKCGVDKA
jgi:hypothetical protein